MGIFGIFLWIMIAVSLYASIYFLFASEMSRLWKGVACALFLGSLALMFVPALSVHWGVPLAMQLFVGFWFVFYKKLE